MGPTQCDKMRERVSLELDGELSPDESLLLERHLRRCPACAVFADNARRYTELLRAAPLEEAPLLVLPRRAGAIRFSVRIGAAVASTAAAALVAVSMVSVTKSSGNQPRVVALDFVPPAAVVERAQGGIVGLRHPSAARSAPRPVLGLQDSSRHGLFDS
jgi:predicted anti-sigma-YlaC factor YlaD